MRYFSILESSQYSEIFKSLNFWRMSLYILRSHTAIFINYITTSSTGLYLIEFVFGHDEVYQVSSKQRVSLQYSRLLLMSVWRRRGGDTTPQEDFLAGARKPLANGDSIKFKGFVEVRSDGEERKFFTLSRPHYVSELLLLTENSAAPVRVYGYTLCLQILSCTRYIECPLCLYLTYGMFF